MSPARRARPGRRRSLVLGLLALPLALLLGTTAFAAWQRGQSLSFVVVAGGMGLSLGQLSWTCPTTGEQGFGLSGLAQLAISPGDALVISQDFTSDLSGDNLAVRLRLAWDNLPSGWTVTWHVESSDGAHLSPADGEAALGESVTLEWAAGSGPTGWLLTVSLTAPPGDPVYADPLNPDAPTPAAVPGPLVLVGEQIRQGAGFAHAP